MLAAFLQAAGNIIPLYYQTVYSVYVLDLSPSASSVLLAVNNAVNSVARVLMGLLADYVGRQNTMIACVRANFPFRVSVPSSNDQLLLLQVLFSGLSVLTLWLDASYERFLAFIVLYGIFSGGYSALLPTTIAEVYGHEHYSSANAAIYFVRGFGAVLGAPIAGLFLGNHRQSGQSALSSDRLKARFNVIAALDGIVLLAAGVCVMFVRWLDAKVKCTRNWRA